MMMMMTVGVAFEDYHGRNLTLVTESFCRKQVVSDGKKTPEKLDIEKNLNEIISSFMVAP